MCGRFGLNVDEETLATVYGVQEILFHPGARYNVAPSQEIPVIREVDGVRRAEGFRWGLVPFWADDPKIGYKMINARSETVARRPAFREPWTNRRRCIVPAIGFYEWRKSAEQKGPSTPWWIRMTDRRPFGFAALWDRWDRGEEPLLSCTILTIDSNALVREIHDRMPVILGDRSSRDLWVDPAVEPEEAAALLASYPAEEMEAYPVSRYVNSPWNEGPECIEPAP